MAATIASEGWHYRIVLADGVWIPQWRTGWFWKTFSSGLRGEEVATYDNRNDAILVIGDHMDRVREGKKRRTRPEVENVNGFHVLAARRAAGIIPY